MFSCCSRPRIPCDASRRDKAHASLINEWRDLRHALQYPACPSLSCFGHCECTGYRPDFRNWSGNVDTENRLSFPLVDADIQRIIHEARARGGTVTVAGAGHSLSPAVCDTGEVSSVVSLASYSMAYDSVAPFPDFQVDPSSSTLTVNAGWNLDRVMSALGKDWPDYIFEAQPAGRIFSIGGLISMCTHGGCMKAGLIADTVTGLRVIDAQGEILHITNEEDLRYYRMSFGAFGVITHATMKLRKITEMKVEAREDHLVMTEQFFAEYFKDKISWDGPLFQQFFFDFYQMKIYYGAWTETGIKRTPKDYGRALDARGGERGLGGAAVLPMLDEFLDFMDLNYRTSDMVTRGLVKASVEVPKLAWSLNARAENDAFWISSLPTPMPASHWVVQMVPVDAPSTTNIFKAVKVAYDRFMLAGQHVKRGGAYRPDCAVEARFVWSSNSYFAPNFSRKQFSQLYFAVEQPTLSSNLYLSHKQMVDSDDHRGEDLQLNREFTKYFADLEKGWMRIDPRVKPHLAKCFGLAPSAEDPAFYEAFSPQSVRDVLSPDRKAKILAKLREKDPSGVFMNKFVATLLQSGSKSMAASDALPDFLQDLLWP